MTVTKYVILKNYWPKVPAKESVTAKLPLAGKIFLNSLYVWFFWDVSFLVPVM